MTKRIVEVTNMEWENNISTKMEPTGAALTCITILSYVLGAITLSTVATTVAIFAGLSTIIYNILRPVS